MGLRVPEGERRKAVFRTGVRSMDSKILRKLNASASESAEPYRQLEMNRVKCAACGVLALAGRIFRQLMELMNREKHLARARGKG